MATAKDDTKASGPKQYGLLTPAECEAKAQAFAAHRPNIPDSWKYHPDQWRYWRFTHDSSRWWLEERDRTGQVLSVAYACRPASKYAEQAPGKPTVAILEARAVVFERMEKKHRVWMEKDMARRIAEREEKVVLLLKVEQGHDDMK
jgi:hypothetical protein